MKKQRFRFKLTALLLTALLALAGFYGLRSVSHYGSRWFSYAANPRLNAQKQLVVEGDILDRSGVTLAATKDGTRVFADSEAVRKAMVHVVGDRQGMVANSVETFHAGYLYGYSSSLMDAVQHLTHPEEIRQGNRVTLTVDAQLSASVPAAFDAHPLTRGKNGAAVVMNYLTGEVLALVSLPGFDPDAADSASLAALDHPFFNRATQALLPPGSVFKIVTSAAALSGLSGLETRTFSCGGSLPVTDTYTVRDFGQGAHGNLTLDQAFVHSCNVTYASLALEMGDTRLRAAAENFGFNRNFLFRDLVVYNSQYPTQSQSREALAASGFGQSAVATTPMHLCLIAAAIARGGDMPEPRLLKRVTTSAGGTVLSFSSASAGTVCVPAVAEKLSAMMKQVVQGGGSGAQAAVTTLDVRGKTGTAVSTVDGQPVNYGWFTGFNAQKDLPVALCILVEDIPDGETGGTTAALIAHDVFSWLKRNPDLLTR
ncbi:MAG: penicillin-binding protein 2 [Clostridia bacterium]|nr:penicillin-binding protein 2 [Clostridia bacterium]